MIKLDERFQVICDESMKPVFIVNDNPMQVNIGVVINNMQIEIDRLKAKNKKLETKLNKLIAYD